MVRNATYTSKLIIYRTLFFMYHSSQYIIFTSCNVVVLRRIILYCYVGWGVKDGAVIGSHQQWLVAKWLGLGVTVRVRAWARECFFFPLCDKHLCVAFLGRYSITFTM